MLKSWQSWSSLEETCGELGLSVWTGPSPISVRSSTNQHWALEHAETAAPKTPSTSQAMQHPGTLISVATMAREVAPLSLHTLATSSNVIRIESKDSRSRHVHSKRPSSYELRSRCYLHLLLLALVCCLKLHDLHTYISTMPHAPEINSCAPPSSPSPTARSTHSVWSQLVF